MDKDAIADYVDIETLMKYARDNKLKTPKPDKDGRYQTLNKRGTTTPYSNYFIDEFARYAQHGKKRVLQIDATFGHHTINALEKPISEFITTDTCISHLAITAMRIHNLLPDDRSSSVKFFHGPFPKSFKYFKSNSLDAVLLNRVLHYYSPKELIKTMKELLRVLKPGGRIYVIAITPYVNRYKSFIPLYKQRLILKQQYPGYLNNLRNFADQEVTTPNQMNQIEDGAFIFFDAQFMYRLLSENGFIIRKCYEFSLSHTSDIWQLDGRELVGAIAQKPSSPSFEDHLIAHHNEF